MPRVKLGYGLTQLTDRDTFQVSGSTPRECFDNMTHLLPVIRNWIYDDDGSLKVSLFINGKIAYEEDLDRKLDEGDELVLLELTDGG